ncbi:MAG: hypothetical protein PHC28_03835, partial [Flavobacterium sp.]|uniref:hypothetical protein n=1 Tax=Flavobacterium sp. TaxID=239 RepID=UPI00262B23E3
MKKLFYASILLFQVLLFAQPTDAIIKQKGISDGAIEVKLIPGKGTIHTTLTEKWYIKSMETKWKTAYPEIKRWERNEYRYNYIGGKWVFDRTYLFESWYDGIPNPTEAEILKSLEDAYVGYDVAVKEKPTFKLADNPKWKWHTYNNVEFLVEAVYYEKTSYTEITHKKVIFPVKLYRDTGNNSYDVTAKYVKGAPWLKIANKHIVTTNANTTILGVTTHSDAEMNSIKSMSQIADENQAKERASSLGALTIPYFTSDREAIFWIHNILREGDKNRIELMTMKMLASYHFVNGSDVILNSRGERILTGLKNGADFYKDLFG